MVSFFDCLGFDFRAGEEFLFFSGIGMEWGYLCTFGAYAGLRENPACAVVAWSEERIGSQVHYLLFLLEVRMTFTLLGS